MVRIHAVPIHAENVRTCNTRSGDKSTEPVRTCNTRSGNKSIMLVLVECTRNKRESIAIACRDSWQPVVKKKRRDLVPRYCAWSCFHSQQASNNAPMAAALIEEERFAQVMVACAIARQPLPRTSQGVARDTKRKVDRTYVCAVASFLPLLL